MYSRSKMRTKAKLLASSLVFVLIFGTISTFAFAADIGDSDLSVAEQLKELADAAVASAEVANDALKAVEDAWGAADDALSDTRDAKVDADEALSDAIENAEAIGNDISGDLSVLADSNATLADKQEAIDAVGERINDLVSDVNEAVKKSQEVVDHANDVIDTAVVAANAANAAVNAANEALASAKSAEALYHDILTSAVNGDVGKYGALAAAENAMSAAWNEYANAQNTADELMNDYHEAILSAAGSVAEALSNATAAQALADTLYKTWMDAEAAMQLAMKASGDTELAALEALRATARDAALTARADARQAKAKAVEVYVMASEAAGIANAAADAVNNYDWNLDALTGAFSTTIAGINLDLASSESGNPGTYQKLGETTDEAALEALGIFDSGNSGSGGENGYKLDNMDEKGSVPGGSISTVNDQGTRVHTLKDTEGNVVGTIEYHNGTDTYEIKLNDNVTVLIRLEGSKGNASDYQYYTVTGRVTLSDDITGLDSNSAWLLAIKVDKLGAPVINDIGGTTGVKTVPELDNVGLGRLAQLATVTIPDNPPVDPPVDPPVGPPVEPPVTPPVTTPGRGGIGVIPGPTPGAAPMQIEDQIVPLASTPYVEEAADEIIEDDVPLAQMPQTGLASTIQIWLLGLILSMLAAMGAIFVITRRAKTECE